MMEICDSACHISGGIMKGFVTSLLIIIISSGAFAQVNQEMEGPPQVVRSIPPQHYNIRWLIDKPTAYMLPKGSFDLDFKSFPGGGVQTAINIGLSNRFMIGLAYGGANILSETSPEWNPKMEFNVRYMLLEQYATFPQMAIGFCSAGYGLFKEEDTSIGYEEDRYLVKSPGFYLSVSKEYPIYTSYISLHGGINYSLENQADSDPNIYFGTLVHLGYNMTFKTEYDAAINDNNTSGIFGRGRGYLNCGVAWYITPQLQIELDFRNVLLNRRPVNDDEELVLDREVRLVYLQFFTD